MGLGSEIRDPEKTFSGSRIQGSKRHQIPDPDQQHWNRLFRFGPESVLLDQMNMISFDGADSGMNVCGTLVERLSFTVLTLLVRTVRLEA
jgi:hypothetical protein